MNRYLFAAEADKIQDFVFRSSRLKEVVGGSQLLTRFCQEVPGLLLPNYAGDPEDKENIIVQDGGGFRLVFDSKEQAMAFGEELAELYRFVTDGSLTVAEPVEIKSSFGAANLEAEENLRRAKRWRNSWREQEQMPYVAFCNSCGVGIAETYHKEYDEEFGYLCSSCLNKRAEREQELEELLNPFYKLIMDKLGLTDLNWPMREENDPTKNVAVYDHRGYVAYLIADGNGMGEIFGKCENSGQMRDLSQKLIEVMREALAEPTLEIMRTNPLEDRGSFIPVLPLIMGGDDLFALIPAPWALDFARCFCRAYEQKMAEAISKIKLTEIYPTISATVVICKSKFPYKIAYQTGKQLLEEAKQLAKEKNRSAVNFTALRGESEDESSERFIRPTLRPYWADGDDLPGWGIPLETLIKQRSALCVVPNKRLSEILKLYDPNELPNSNHELPEWNIKLDRLLNRIAHRNKEHAELLENSLSVLGKNRDQASGWLYHVKRSQNGFWWGHALPDLLDTWDYALKIDKPRSEYEGGLINAGSDL